MYEAFAGLQNPNEIGKLYKYTWDSLQEIFGISTRELGVFYNRITIESS